MEVVDAEFNRIVFIEIMPSIGKAFCELNAAVNMMSMTGDKNILGNDIFQIKADQMKNVLIRFIDLQAHNCGELFKSKTECT